MHLRAVLILTGALATVAPAASLSRYRKPEPTVRYPQVLVEAEWLKGRGAGGGLTVVDARPAGRYARQHVAGAISFDAAACDPDPSTLSRRLGAAGIPGGGMVICYGDAQDPVAAGRLFWLLELAGHRGARVLGGGLEGWRAAGGRMESGARAAAGKRFAARPDTSRIADFRYAMAIFGVKGHTVMDWRPDSAWRAGHVPHSLSFPLDRLLRPDGAYLDGRHMRPVFQVFGPRANEFVPIGDEYVVCGDIPPGGAPIHPYLAARAAAIARVRCYPGGYSDWRAHEEAPVVRIAATEEVRGLLARSAWDRLRRKPPRDAILFDLREGGDFDAGHLPGAVLLPSYEFEKQFESLIAKHWPRADRARTPLIVYCYGPGCTRSRFCSTTAARHGWRNLWWYKDGVEGWRSAGLALERGQ
jgi:thiosulfate/3-mercaptopyruvate sulfurtransferase